jgi:hypothetical protein
VCPAGQFLWVEEACPDIRLLAPFDELTTRHLEPVQPFVRAERGESGSAPRQLISGRPNLSTYHLSRSPCWLWGSEGR